MNEPDTILYQLSSDEVVIPRAQYEAYKAAAKLIMTRAGLRYEPENECPCWDCEYARVLAALRSAGIHETEGGEKK